MIVLFGENVMRVIVVVIGQLRTSGAWTIVAARRSIASAPPLAWVGGAGAVGSQPPPADDGGAAGGAGVGKPGGASSITSAPGAAASPLQRYTAASSNPIA